MAHSLGFDVIAEGVETPEQMAFLRGLACEEMQGFLFSPPLKPEAFEALMREGRRLDVATSASGREPGPALRTSADLGTHMSGVHAKAGQRRKAK
jgi:predicted signal transduction protein with EAL and GGDEF domain